MQGKKFISPGAWFAMSYPSQWNEFEDGEGSFLFYNPEVWTGNFRISAYKGGANFGRQSVEQELKENPTAVRKRVGALDCAYSKEMFQEEGEFYTTHVWIVGVGELAFDCSFTLTKGGDIHEAEETIASLEVRHEGEKYPAELIPIRLMEIYQLNESYEWATNLVKEELKVDFQGTEEDLENLQKIVDKEIIGRKKRDEWVALGITLCVIFANEVDGAEWRTLVDGNREAPVLMYGERLIDPMKLTWSKVKAGEPCNLIEAYNELL